MVDDLLALKVETKRHLGVWLVTVSCRFYGIDPLKKTGIE
jgi:hypothetical protein